MMGLILDTVGNCANDRAIAMQEIEKCVGCEMCKDTQCTIDNKENFDIPVLDYDENSAVLMKSIQ